MSTETIGRVIDYIEANLTEDIRVAQMAAVAGYSVAHFAHRFKALTTYTPHNYLLRRRLS